VLVALAMFGSSLPLRRWLSLLGIVSAAAILVGTLEPAGFEPAANVVVVGYILWSVWLAATGILLLRKAPQADSEVESTTRIGSLTGSHRDR